MDVTALTLLWQHGVSIVMLLPTAQLRADGAPDRAVRLQQLFCRENVATEKGCCRGTKMSCQAQSVAVLDLL
jgi:hypothetical protein